MPQHTNTRANPEHDPQNPDPNIPEALVDYDYSSGISFFNPSPKTLYNFDCSPQFLNNGNFEFELKYKLVQNIVLADDASQLDNFQVSLIVYDIDEEELILHDANEVDKESFGPFPNITHRYKK